MTNNDRYTLRELNLMVRDAIEMELPDEDFYLGVQYHPEFKSRPDKAHPLFKGFIREAGKRHGHS